MPRSFGNGGFALDCKTTAFGRQEPCCKGGVKSSVRAFYSSFIFLPSRSGFCIGTGFWTTVYRRADLPEILCKVYI